MTTTRDLSPSAGSATDATTLTIAGWSIRRVPIESRRLLTIGPDDEVWDGTIDRARDEEWGGAIVRVEPAARASDDAILDVVEAVRKAGASATKLLPRQRADEAAPAAEVERAAKAPRRTLREVVTELVGEDAALAEFCGGVMDQEGL